MRQKEAVNGRVEPAIKQAVTDVAAEADVTVSEIVRRAVRNYIENNPDGYAALGEADLVRQILEDLEP